MQRIRAILANYFTDIHIPSIRWTDVVEIIVLAMLLSHSCLRFMSSFVASMGIVLSSWTVYPLEWAIAALVFVISVLPTMISILHMSRQESL